MKSKDEFIAAIEGPKKKREFSFYPNFVSAESIDPTLGKRAVEEGKVGALMLAGGVGSRLRFDKPKGLFPIYKKKSLYQILAEKVGAKRQLAIMTSTRTDKETREWFYAHNYFGLKPSQVDFFCQESWPYLDFNREYFQSAPNVLAEGPNGNGAAVSLFAKSPIYKKWQELGISHISLFSVDNPLADPFDCALLSHHVESGAEITLAVGKKLSPDENLGVVGLINGKLAVIEYIELSVEQRKKFLYGYLAQMVLSMEFAFKVKDLPLPIHVAKKATKKFTNEGETVYPSVANAFKFEQFIFDLLNYSEASEAVILDRAQSFAPLKELRDVEVVERALQAKERAGERL